MRGIPAVDGDLAVLQCYHRHASVQDKTDVPAEVNEKQKPRFELGQRVLVQDTRLKKPLPAVVVGWDACCAENDEWKELNDLNRLEMVCCPSICIHTVSCGHVMLRLMHRCINQRQYVMQRL